MAGEEELATLEELAQASVPVPKPDKMAQNEAEQFRHEERMQETQLGWVGKVWGSRSEKPGNISAIVAIILVLYMGILMGASLWGEAKALAEIQDTLSMLSSIVTLILGYLFGSNDRR